MVLLMARPTKRPDSPFLQFRKRVPADVLERARGQRITFTFPSADIGGADVTVSVTLANEVKFSLRRTRPFTFEGTSMDSRLLNLNASSRTFETGRNHLTHKQRLALAGIFRRSLSRDWQDDPGNPGRLGNNEGQVS